MSGYHKREAEPFPVHTLKRVERPTTKILDDQVRRVDERESGFNKAARGDYGEVLMTERGRFVLKYPFSAALMQMQITLREIVVASSPRRRPRFPKIRSGEGKP
jgi:hypothetical protein